MSLTSKVAISTNTITETANQVLAEAPSSITVSSPGLSSFSESANVLEVSSKAPANVERSISQPYKIDVPNELLGRNYLVDSFNWTPGMAVRRIDFPSAMSAIPTISNVMSRFTYWRATFHVEIKVSTTQFHQGSLLTSWVPVAGSGIPTSLSLHTGLSNAAVLSASTQESVTYDIPYLHPSDWLKWATYAATSAHSSLFIQELNTLTATSDGISTSCPVLVYASMRDVQVTGFQSQMHAGKKFEFNAEAQAKKSNFDAKTAVSTVSQIARKLPIIGDAWNPIADAVNAFAGNLSNPLSTASLQPVESRYAMTANLSSGVDDATQFSLYPNATITQSPEMFGMDTSHQTVAGIAKHPMIFDTVTFDGTTTSWSTVVDPQSYGTFLIGDYLFQMAKFFKYWRGSIKFLVHFCMPAFYQCRIQFTLDYLGTPNNVGDIPQRVVDIKGTSWEEIEVPFLYFNTWKRTDTTVTIPILKITQLTTILGSSAIANPKIYVNIFRAAGEDMQFAVPRSAKTSWPESAPKIGYQSQMLIGKRFQNKFQAILEGTTQSVELRNVMPEQAGTVADMQKRIAPIASAFTTLPVTNTATANPPDLFTQMNKFFLFWRGSRTVKHMLQYDQTGNGTQFITLQTGSSTAGWSDARAFIYNSQLPNYQSESFNCPYYSGQPYYPLINQTSLYIHSSAYIDTPTDLGLSSYAGRFGSSWYVRAGDDYVCLFTHPFLFNAGISEDDTPPEDTSAKRSKVNSLLPSPGTKTPG